MSPVSRLPAFAMKEINQMDQEENQDDNHDVIISSGKEPYSNVFK